MVLSLVDWRKALQAPPTYRIGNSTLRIQTKVMSFVIVSGLITLVFLFFYSDRLLYDKYTHSLPLQNRFVCSQMTRNYNVTYPLTAPLYMMNSPVRTFRIGIIADLDQHSKLDNNRHEWVSYYKKGYLSFNLNDQTITLTWDSEPEMVPFKSAFSEKDRGMELSELVTFDGRLLTVDDRTGLVYELFDNLMIPWVILLAGSGRQTKGFKGEWMAVKDGYLYVGSMGKEWTTASGEFVNNDPMFIKVISLAGEIRSFDWTNNYKSLRKSMGISWPGYVLHESAAWSSYHSKWFFLPRRCSRERYNETTDESAGCDKLLISNESFTFVKVVKLPTTKATHGFSSFKFIPDTNDYVIVAIKSEEHAGQMASYITAFTIDGKELMPITKIANKKFEGFEFI